MDATLKNELIESFFMDPELAYQKLSGAGEEERALIFELEEFMANLLYNQMDLCQQDEVTGEEYDEIMAEIVDHINDLTPESSHVAETLIKEKKIALAAIQQILTATHSLASGPNKEVPSVLLDVVNRTGASGTKQTNAPSLILKLAREGIQIIKSTLQGVEFLPQEAVAVRSSSPLLDKKRPHLSFEQSVGGEGGIRIHYEVVHESDLQLMLTLQIFDKIGSFRVNLKQDGRIIDSRSLNRGEDIASFSHLGAGYYDVEMRGSVDHDFRLMIQ